MERASRRAPRTTTMSALIKVAFITELPFSRRTLALHHRRELEAPRPARCLMHTLTGDYNRAC
jgi:hypothetical protein